MNTKAQAQSAFEAIESDLQELSQWMYDNPEIAYEEHKTSARMVELLRSNGFDVEYPAYGIDTSFAARIGDSGPQVVICAEMDALPEVGQACGHNIIGTAAIGAGVALAKLVDTLGIRVTVLGTPAEEHLGGKVELINAGAFEDVSAAMMIHPGVVDLVDPDFLAITHVEVDFYGKASHAAGEPELGINALDAAVQAYVNVSMLRQRLLDTDRVHGVITHGGGAANVIPSHTSMSWGVRSTTFARLDEMYPLVEACFKAAADATGCSYELKQVGHRYTAMRNDTVLTELYKQNSATLGRPVSRLADIPPRSTGSTDMANVSYEVPTIHPMLDLSCYPIVNHQPEFAAHTVTDDGKSIIRDGALAMAWSIIDLAEGDHWSELGTF